MLNEFTKTSGIVVAIKANYLLVDIISSYKKIIRLLCTSRTKLKFSGFFIAVGYSVVVQSIDWKNLTGISVKTFQLIMLF